MRLAKALIRLRVSELPHCWKSNVAAQIKQSFILSPPVMTCHRLLMSACVLVQPILLTVLDPDHTTPLGAV